LKAGNKNLVNRINHDNKRRNKKDLASLDQIVTIKGTKIKAMEKILTTKRNKRLVHGTNHCYKRRNKI
jgi:hypothetical protein